MWNPDVDIIVGTLGNLLAVASLKVVQDASVNVCNTGSLLFRCVTPFNDVRYDPFLEEFLL
jgi:hypothetical protein